MSGDARNEAEHQLRAQAFVLTIRAQRPIKPRVSGYGQYGYQRDRFAGILDRNAVEVGLAYSLLAQAPHKLNVDAGLGYASEQRLLGNNLSTATLGAGGLYTPKIFTGQRAQRRRAFRLLAVRRDRLALC